MKYISGGAIWPVQRIIEFVERQIRHFDELGYCLWKLVLRCNDRLVGFCGLQPLDDLPGVEIGWWLASDLWGHLWDQSLATEAAHVAKSGVR
jgi:RimJ/RimL family protein N-acetyltransferase